MLGASGCSVSRLLGTYWAEGSDGSYFIIAFIIQGKGAVFEIFFCLRSSSSRPEILKAAVYVAVSSSCAASMMQKQAS